MLKGVKMKCILIYMMSSHENEIDKFEKSMKCKLEVDVTLKSRKEI